ncbi:hypothetical protein JCM10213_007798 [Rhodosporidiobolus nylandii]
MLDRIPPELLDQILDLAAPTSEERDEARERRRTLLSCSLICRTLQNHAQPLLWRVVEFSTWEQAHALVKVDEASGMWAMARTLKAWDKDGLQTGRVVEVLARMTSLKEVCLAGFEEARELHLDVFTELPALEYLALQGLPVALTSPSLFCLRELSLNYLQLRRGTAARLLLPEALPSLRALALSQIEDSSCPGSFEFSLPTLPPSLLNQLDIFELHTVDSYLFAPQLIGESTVVVLGDDLSYKPLILDDSSSPALSIRHFRVPYIPPPSDPSIHSLHTTAAILNRLDALVSLLRRPVTSILSIHLPESLKPDAANSHCEEICHATVTVLALCGARGVEVVWQGGGFKPFFAVSQQACAYLRGRRAKEQSGHRDEGDQLAQRLGGAALTRGEWEDRIRLA